MKMFYVDLLLIFPELQSGTSVMFLICLVSNRSWYDKGYDANYMIEAANAEPVIPSRSNRKIPRKCDKELYKERNLIERMFNKIKHFCRVATRYDKLSITFLLFVHLAVIYLWLK